MSHYFLLIQWNILMCIHEASHDICIFYDLPSWPFILSSLHVFLLRFPSLSYYMLRVLALLCDNFGRP